MDPGDPTRLYAGAAAGGVWTSANEGQLWEPRWPRFVTQNIGALAINPQDANGLICATGEGNLSSDSYPGGGVFHTTDAGFTWNATFTAPGGGPLSEAARALMPRRIGTVAFGFEVQSPGKSRIALGAVSDSETIPAALYLDSGDAGLLPVTFWGDRNYNCYSVLFHPVLKDRIYTAIQPGGTLNGIWRSDDFGQSWIRLQHGLPPPEICQRISLAMAPSDPNVIYALVSKTVVHTVLGVFKSKDAGETWHEIGGTHFADETQLSYNNCIAVHPKNPDFVLCGATEVHLSINGGRAWTQITTGDPGRGSKPPANYVHNDHHALLINPDGWIYSGNDGGVAVSQDSGKTWHPRAEGMVTAMFYAADVAQSNSKVFGGGTQDNGTLIAGVLPGAADDSFEYAHVLDGDGGWLQFDPSGEQNVFASTSDFSVFHHKHGEPWVKGDNQLAGWPEVSIPAKDLLAGEAGQRSIFVMAIEPGAARSPRNLYLGTSRLWRTSDDGRHWEPLSEIFDATSISAIACSPLDHRQLFLGTTAGGLYRTRDACRTWSANLSGPAIPPRLITRIAFHPVERATIVITVASTGLPGASLARAQPQTPYGHVFRSADGGDTWIAIDNGELPDVVYNALAFETQPPYRIFVGGDAGVWVTTKPAGLNQAWADCGWASFAGNMPNVVISDLNFHHDDRILTAATYGRGIWRYKAHEPMPDEAPIPAGANADIGPSAVGWLLDPSKPGPVLTSPADKAVFSNFPRTTPLAWQPVDGAIGYFVDVITNVGVSMPGFRTATNSAMIDFIGAQTGTWRVWALFKDGFRSLGSSRTFVYTV
jgi:photosystem II stability/assembly factor-like uncharacterized protein